MTADIINILIKLENKIKDHKNYKKVCLASPDSLECSEDSFTSFTSLFTESELAGKISKSELSAKLDFILNDEDTYDSNSFLFGK